MPRGRKTHHHVAKDRTPDEVLSDEIGKFYQNPLGYVMFNFPWDTEESIRLIKMAEGVEDLLTDDDRKRQTMYRHRFPGCIYGPDLWACDFLEELGREIRKRAFNGIDPVDPIYMATVSGHEIGKSVLVAWLTKFIMDTRPNSVGSLTAVTDEQLRTKTWGEVGKWHAMSLTEHWYNFSSSRGNMSMVSKQFPKWRVDARTSREEKSESFQGQHAPKATSFYIFDEASGVPNKIFEVREGGLTSGEPMVFDFGNGTRNSGAFFDECVGKMSHRYIVRSIDSRTVKITNKKKIAQDAEDRGEDSDFFKVRWRGLFPDRSRTQFIDTTLVDAAMAAEDINENSAPLVIGVDVARFGDDSTVIWPRQGRDARSWPPEAFHGLDTVQVTGRVVDSFRKFVALGVRPSRIFVDGGGVGGGVVDQLRSLGYPVSEVQFGSRPTYPAKYRFKSDEIWGEMRDAIRGGLVLPRRNTDEGHTVHQDLTQREYGFMINGQTLHLETKDDMKARGLPSPDYAEALAVTYAEFVMDVPRGMQSEGGKVHDEYDPFGSMKND